MLFKQIRCLCTTTSRYRKVVPSNLKGKSTSSQQWLTRQLSDPYVEKAKMLNYRCRSAFKLIEMDEKYNFLSPGQTVVDCGAAPGSWTQVAVNRVNSNGRNLGHPIGKVIAVDKQHIYPIEGAIILGNSDFTMAGTQQGISSVLNGSKVDVVMSDMAPNATGIREMDNENMLNLCYTALRFSAQMSEIDATFVVKLWQCGELQTLQNDICRFYKTVKIIKPLASRSNSAEIFLLARNFKGLKVS